MLEIIQTSGLSDAVDLVEGGHFDLLFSEVEVEDMVADFEAAKVADIDVSAVRFHSKDEMKKVGLFRVS